MESHLLDAFLSQSALPPDIDINSIRQEWFALRPPFLIANRRLPVPLWARRPFTEDGSQAWKLLQQDVPALDHDRAFCIYIHIPFCPERCAFCDCYSFRLSSHRERHVGQYLDLLAREMDLWSSLGSLAVRPVSTVHLGGGTPTFLRPTELERLVRLCRDRFAVGSHTEWALESTASELTPGMLSRLDSLGFTRLHVGVQTLEKGVREVLNRRSSAEAVLRSIAASVEIGWVVSVDLIYGLPGQTLEGLLSDIRTLAAVGADGFSLYELQLSSRNAKFAHQYGLDRRDRRLNYLLGQVASRQLVAAGFRKTLFNHFAAAHDTNLYFTFPEREEDCLALGTIADGVFADYHYRHPEYAAYGRAVDGDSPGLEGGLRRSELENRLQPLTSALMAGRVPPSLFENATSQALLHRWRQALLLVEDSRSGDLVLTGSGSWFVGNMLSQLAESCAAAEEMAGDDGPHRA